ncbi:MAG: YihY/virulence factor BrkB family protein [Alphaproteobacteria bacterium]|nr:YihY/virulence factor BrkB family protein [Alphaproteobacteria bacterium]
MDDIHPPEAEAHDRRAGLEAGVLQPQRGAGGGSADRLRRPGSHNEWPSEDGRGRTADTPSLIPAPGWKDILLRVYRSISEDRLLANAAAVTFYALLALFPAIAALVSIYGLFADPATIANNLNSISGILPGGAVDVVRDQLNRLAAQPRGTLGISFLIGLIISLWSATGGIKALCDALNVVYQEKEERGFIRLNATSLAFTVAMIAFLIVAIACIVAVPVALHYLPGFIGPILDIARWPVLLVLVAVALACMYRYGPSRTEPRWRWVTWGSALAALGWLGVSALFSWYTAHFGSYNKTYGSLGAVIGFMTWMWLSVTVILVGGKLNAETEHQTACESTEGSEKPLGKRGARMADTVGESQT